MGNQSEQSPWLSIWVRPKETIRKIVSASPKRALWLLATIYGFVALLSAFQSFSIGAMIGIIPLFLIALILAPICGYVNFAIWGFVILWTGKLFKGKADFQKVRAAYAWSCVPYVGSGVIWIFMVALFGAYLFLSPPLIPQHFVLLFLIFSIAKVIFSVWAIVIYINAVSEVQGFSILSAIGNIILAILAVAVVFWILWVILCLLMGVTGGAVNTSGSTFQMLQDGMQFYKIPL